MNITSPLAKPHSKMFWLCCASTWVTSVGDSCRGLVNATQFDVNLLMGAH